MKKFLCFIFVGLFVLSCVPTAQAASIMDHGIIYEYDVLKSVKAASNEDSKNFGLSSAELEEIRALDFLAMAQEFKAMSYTELVDRGITPASASIILASNDTDIILYAALGRVTYSVSKTAFYQSGNNTILKTNTVWEWSQVPLFLFCDIIATYTSTDFTCSSCSGMIVYREIGVNNSIANTYATTYETEAAGRIAYSVIPIIMVYESQQDPSNYTRWYAKNGSINIAWRASGNITCVGIACKYGQARLSLQPGISVGSGINFSFTPTLSIATGPEDYHQITR